MRPTPAEVIAGVRRILGEVVEPEVSSDYARSRLREVRAVLAQVDWDNAGTILGDRVDRLGSLLRECAEWVSADPGRRDHFAKSGVALPDSPPVEPQTFADRNEASANYDSMVVALIGPLEDWLCAHPDSAGHELRKRLLDHYGG